MIFDVQIRVGAHLVLQRIHAGHQVPAHPVGVDQLLDAGDLVDLLLRVDLNVGGPVDRFVGDPQGLEDLLIEALLAQQQLVDGLEELSRHRTLDDPVIVG